MTRADSNSVPPKTKDDARQHPMAGRDERDIVFISHANPEDNDLTAWYGARLTAAGYEVWTDLTRLIGGEEMWLDIAEALRYRVRKVVVLLSAPAVRPEKEGVRAELDRAAAIRGQLGDRRFIIPVKIDDVPYTDLPPTISNRTIINGRDNHAEALSQILTILEKDSVPRKCDAQVDALQHWQKAMAPSSYEPEAGRDELVTNRLPLIELPETLRIFEIKRPLKNAVTEPAQIAKQHPLPLVALHRSLVGFADWDEVQEPISETTPIETKMEIQLSDFTSGGTDDVKVAPREAKKLLTSLIRQAWDNFAGDRGFASFELSEKKNAWYVRARQVNDDGDKVWFTRASGTKGWRQLTGRFGLRNCFWHFGVAAVFVPGKSECLKLTPHMIYTDMKGEAEPTAAFRRAHCKFWFNGKWRDLLYGYLAVIQGEDGEVALPFGRSTVARFSATPEVAALQVRPAEAPAKSVPEDEEGDAVDIDMSGVADDPAFSALFDDGIDDEEDPE